MFQKLFVERKLYPNKFRLGFIKLKKLKCFICFIFYTIQISKMSAIKQTIIKNLSKKNLMNTIINEATEFVAPDKTIIIKNEWLCQSVPCYIISKTTDSVQIKPFNKSSDFHINISEFEKTFKILKRDLEFVYVDGYPDGRIPINEFSISPIYISDLYKHFKNNTSFIKLLKKAEQDSYTGKGNTFCINMKDYNEYIEKKETSKLERIGDPIFNRTSRHTFPISSTFSRKDYEESPSFPAPIGIRYEDFTFPSEQNEILREMLTQIFNCVNAPECPKEFQDNLCITITPNSHMCEWCGEKMDISELNQDYCSKEHSVNFCHRVPSIGTKKGNVYIGHCSCNREQGGYSEVERVQQIIRLAKYNSFYRDLILKELL